ncbi:MAG: BamA/TamA family outer membrane protein [Bacteroidota bacterium]
MSAPKPLIYKTILRFIAFGGLVLIASSCSNIIVKKYQPGKPFVYETNINVNGNFSKQEKAALTSRLKGQLDDSMRARSVSKLFWSVMKSPPLYETANADKSVLSMRALLNALGYFNDTITYKDSIKITDKDQHRTTINFNVTPGKQVLLDSIRYNIRQSDLQRITDSSQKDAFIKKGDPFAKATISAELDRLVDLYRNNGYLRFSKDELKGYWDTLNLALLNPSLDPFEQITLLDSIRKSRINPKANLEIRLKPGFDTSRLIKYYVGQVSVYPDFNQDTVNYSRKEAVVDGVKVIYYRRIFKPKILPPNIYFRTGDLYKQANYFKTISRLSSLGSWNLVNIDTSRRYGEDTVDFNIRMSPDKKYSFTTNLEGSRNQSAVSGNLFGLAISFGLQNRNFARAANQANTNVRFGIELGNNQGQRFVQTQQVVLSHNIIFPRPILISKLLSGKMKENAKTLFSANIANTDRKDLYNLVTVNGSFGYDFQKNKILLTIRYPNIEYSYLKARQKLLDLFDSTPSLKNIFTDGFIESMIGGLTITGGKNKNINIFRVNGEISGLLSSFIKKNSFLDSNLYRFLKLDAEFTRKIQFPKTAIALRLFAGVGWEFNSTVNPLKKNNLPFFKQYFSGGPNSMRAWGLRRLGPGSTVKEFSAIPERYGDVQLEANVEYRFPITSISGVQVNGALFTDVGNVWFLKKSAGLPEEVFNFGRLATDLAVGAGAGIRIDFNFFIIRLDYSYKVKDPSPSLSDAAVQNKWFGYKFSKGDQFQLGVRYPFIL